MIQVSVRSLLDNLKDYQKSFEYDIRSLIMAFYPNYSDCINYSSVCNGLDAQGLVDGKKIIIIIKEDELEIEFHEINLPIIKDKIQISYKEKGKVYKNHLKRLLYKILSIKTGKELPWGTLTGIRPVKIPMELLENKIPIDEIKQIMQKEYLITTKKSELCLSIAQKEAEILNYIIYQEGYSLYIGIPICPSKCLYCSFTSLPLDNNADCLDEYLEALIKEIEFVKNNTKDKIIKTIYVGGGTPTVLNPNQLKRLLFKINESFKMDSIYEFTVEAGRPDTITKEKLAIMKKYNVTRISINPQTMKQSTLDLIGRKHTAKDVEDVFYTAREMGHNNINMDIILGLPGEDIYDVEDTLNKISKLSPDSLTVHTLAIKRAADLKFDKDRIERMQESDISNMFSLVEGFTKTMDMLPYYLYRQKNMTGNLENVGYAKNSKEGIYNIIIMEEKHSILALGAGAVSKFIFKEQDYIERVENVKNVRHYINRIDEMILRKRKYLSKL